MGPSACTRPDGFSSMLFFGMRLIMVIGICAGSRGALRPHTAAD